MITLKDVAKECGLNVSTVSRIINNKGYISEEAKEKVAAAMQKLNYHPNEVARSLRKQESGLIGVIVPKIDSPYYARVLSELEASFNQYGYRIILFNTNNSSDTFTDYVNECYKHRVAGIILMSITIDISTLMNINVPLVVIERKREGGTCSIVCDNYQGGRLAAECLIDAGCRNLLNLTAVADSNLPSDLRENGFVDACEQAGVRYRVVRTTVEEFNDENYLPKLEKVLTGDERYDGIFAGMDQLGADVVGIAHRRGIRIPEDVKLVSHDDTSVSTYLSPSMTSVHQDLHTMCKRAADVMIDALAGKEVPKEIVVPVQLIERESTRH